MEKDRFIQPDSCEINGCYYRRLDFNGNGSEVIYEKVRFLSYRPHPAEVLIHDGKRPRVIHRCYLYVKVPDSDRSV